MSSSNDIKLICKNIILLTILSDKVIFIIDSFYFLSNFYIESLVLVLEYFIIAQGGFILLGYE